MRLFALLSLITASLLCSCSKPKEFVYKDIRNIKLESLNTTETKASLDLVFYNPNSYGVSLKKVDCDVYLDSNYAGKLLLDTLMYIPATSEFTLPAHLNVNVGSIAAGGLSMLLGKDVLITAKGKSRVGKGGFYVNISFSYEGRHKLNFF